MTSPSAATGAPPYPWDSDTQLDPYAMYARLRDEAPVASCASDEQLRVVSRYDDVRVVLTDWRRFSSADGPGYARIPIGGPVSLDPPEHGVVRSLATPLFTPANLTRLGEELQPAIDAMVDGVLGEEVDLVDTITDVLPVLAICRLLGLPVDEAATFRNWADQAFALNGAVDRTTATASGALAAFDESVAYFSDAIARRRSRPGTDGLSRIATMETTASDEQVSTLSRGLLTAGNGTTRAFLGHLLRLLGTHPTQWAALRADPGLIDAAVEEALRYESPIQGFFRSAVDDAEIAGVEIPAGSRVLALYGSANRDERRFAAADRFSLSVPRSRHLAFGVGPHLCLGAAVARLQGALLLRSLLDRVATIELVADPILAVTPVSRGVSSLRARLHVSTEASGGRRR